MVSFFDGYWNFLKKNKLLVFVGALTLLMAYSARLFNGAIGTDVQLYMNQEAPQSFFIRIGRFGLVWLMQLTEIGGLDIYFENFCSLFLLILAVMLWGYWLQQLAENRLQVIPMLMFTVYFLSSGVWQESLYFTFQAIEITLVIFACPIFLHVLFQGILKNNNKYLFAAVLIFTAMMSVYQAVVVLAGAGILAGYIIQVEKQSENDSNDVIGEWQLLSKSMLVMVTGILLWWGIYHLLLAFVYNMDESTYLTGQAGIKESGYLKTLLRSGYYAFMMIFGHVGTFDTLIAAYAGKGIDSIKAAHDYFYTISSIGYMPIIITYGYIIIKKHNDTMKRVVMILLPLTIMFFPIVGGGSCSLRTQWSIPLAIGFIFLYVLQNTFGTWNKAMLAIIFSVCFFQIQYTARVNYSEQRMFEFDARIAHTLDYDMRKYLDGSDISDVSVFLYGSPSPSFSGSFVGGSMGRVPIWAWDKKALTESTGRGVTFMMTQGYNWNPISVDSADVIELRKVAKMMPKYPENGYIKRVGNVLLVKLSEGNYDGSFLK